MTRRAPRLMVYRAGWPARFAHEADRLRRVLGPRVRAIHHIGSTAVPGLWAKPVIDILIAIDGLAAFDRLGERMLKRLGYVAHGENGIARRRFFQKGRPEAPSYHVHVFPVGDAGVRRHLAFRDYLRAHSEIAARYRRCKQRAVARARNRETYARYKAAFIQATERRAMAWMAGRI